MSELDDMRDTGGMAPVGDEVNTDSLMGDFRGKNIVVILTVTVVIHTVLIFGTSFSFLKQKVFGTSTEGLEKEKRVEVALGEAKTALNKIAERHDLEVTDITAKIAGAGSRASKVTEAAAQKTPTVDPKAKKVPNPKEKDPDEKKTEFEKKKFAKPEDGPKKPGDDDDDDDAGLD